VTARLAAADWTARWITPPEDADPGPGNRPAHLLRRDVTLPAAPATATLHATALGLYEAHVNGLRVGDEELTPGHTSYDRTLYAQAFDVTGLLAAGANRLEITLSDGWYRGEVGAFRQPAAWGPRLAARAELHVTFADGSRRVIVTDGSWTAHLSPIVRASLMAGQTTDFTVEPGPGEPVLVDAVTAPPITYSPAPPVRVIETRPVQAWTQVGGAWIADFGQNASGWIHLADPGPAGTRTVIDHGEHLGPDGDLDTSHLDSVRPDARLTFSQRDEVISAGTGQPFEPRHTVHGFRYARFQITPPSDTPPAAVRRVVHTDLVPVGSFETSDPDLNRLFEVARWSFRGNAVDIPTDCPTRERLGWTGDWQVFAPTATRLYDVLGFSRKWLQSVRDDQLPDGRIANFSPDGRHTKLRAAAAPPPGGEARPDEVLLMTGSAGWGDAVVAVPWELYETYGDPAVLAENYEAMTRWVDWALGAAAGGRHPARIARSAEPADHEGFIWDATFHWGEWCEPKPRAADGRPVNPLETNPAAWFMADKGEVATAYLYRSAATLAQVAGLLDDPAAAATYAAAADNVRAAWQTEYLQPDGRTAGDTQAGYVRALDFGLIPEELRPAAADRLVELIRAHGNHLATGFLSTGSLLPVLADTGHADVAYDVLCQRTPPGWLAMLDRGATTVWEDWDGIDGEGRAHDSLNHYSKGAVVRFLLTHTLGLRQAEGSVGWERFTVAPVAPPWLTWARGRFDSPRGPITVEWRRSAGLSISVTAPPDTTYTVIEPTEEQP
jgi:alpha-L-rhamnosidase